MTKPSEPNNPILTERGDGLGWTFNFNNKWSYVILFLILGASVAICIWASIQK